MQFIGGGSYGHVHRYWLYHSLFGNFGICMSDSFGYTIKMTKKELDVAPIKSTSSPNQMD